MARVLVVACGGRGRALAASLAAVGHAVRGTTREPARLAAVAESGTEPVVADPDRLSTLTPHLDGVSVVCWLMGGAIGEPDLIAALHGPRLQSLLAKLVDTPVRGFVYEAAGTVPGRLLEQGSALVQAAGARHHMPVAVVREDPARRERWLAAMTNAVGDVLAR